MLGDPDMRMGDFRLEWADGGVTRDAGALTSQIAASIARHVGRTGQDAE